LLLVIGSARDGIDQPPERHALGQGGDSGQQTAYPQHGIGAMAENGRKSHKTKEGGHGTQSPRLTPHQREKTQPLKKESSGSESFHRLLCYNFVCTGNHNNSCLLSCVWPAAFVL